MYLGANASSAGGIENSIKTGKKYQINTIQMVPSAPMRWITKPIPKENIVKFVNEIEGSGVEKILIHGIYLVNLARKDKKLYHLGKEGLRMHLDFAEKATQLIKEKELNCEILGVCFHPGSQKELSFEDSIERISYGIDWVLEQVPGSQKLLIETTAGTGVDGFDEFFGYADKLSPLGNASADSCADFCVVMFSDFTRNITMQNLYHDGGFSSVGMSEALMK